jgi:hypothetical protein
MRDLHASVSGHTSATPESAAALLGDVEAYPSWYPAGIKQVDVLERDGEGRPSKIFTVLALNEGPIKRDFAMDMAVTHEPDAVTLSRLPRREGDEEALRVTFRVAPGTEITAEFNASLSIPGWLPLGGIEKAIPQGFLDAALKQLG